MRSMLTTFAHRIIHTSYISSQPHPQLVYHQDSAFMAFVRYGRWNLHDVACYLRFWGSSFLPW